jgi:hypothetical protein
MNARRKRTAQFMQNVKTHLALINVYVRRVTMETGRSAEVMESPVTLIFIHNSYVIFGRSKLENC